MICSLNNEEKDITTERVLEEVRLEITNFQEEYKGEGDSPTCRPHPPNAASTLLTAALADEERPL